MVRRLSICVLLIMILSACTTEDQTSQHSEQHKSKEQHTKTQDNKAATSGQSSSNKSKEETKQQNDDNEFKESEVEQDKDNQSTNFDIDSEEVLSYFNSTEGSDRFFTQDTITLRMSYQEVEDKFGPNDGLYYMEGADAAIYGNLAVMYNSNMINNNDFDPETNLVNRVYYFANISPDEFTSVMGKPSNIRKNIMGVEDSELYIYKSKDDNQFPYSFSAKTALDKEKQDIITTVIRSKGEQPNVDDYPKEITTKDAETYEAIEAFLIGKGGYFEALEDYYNEHNSHVLELIEGSAYDQIDENKKSGNYFNYTAYSPEILSITEMNPNSFEVTVSRAYSHDSSNGKQESQVTYYIDSYNDVSDLSLTHFNEKE